MTGERDAGWKRLGEAVLPNEAIHPVDPGALGEYALLVQERGEAAAARVLPDVARHLATHCTRCAEDLREFAADGVTLSTPSDWRAAPRRLLATLIAAPSRPLALSLRGTQPGAVWMFHADPVSITLVASTDQHTGLLIEGTVGGMEVPDAALARLLAATNAESQVPVDSYGHFELANVLPGTYRLELELGELIVTIEDLVLGE